MGAAGAVVHRCTICHTAYSAGERFCPLDGGAIAPDDPHADPRIGRTIDGRYFVRRLIGRGGMGAVYEADHVGLDKRVAIKFLAIDKADRDALARFRREAKIASRIVHEHVVQIFDVGTADSDTDFIVMEYLEGRDLAAVLRETSIDARRTLSIIRKVLRGLRAIHQAGIVHRDIKPANILLAPREDDRDFVKIMDFGISKPIAGDKITQTGAIIGTPEFMAPEQLLADDVDARADLYAVGLVMYRMLAGRLPFTGELFDRASAASPYVPVPSLATFRPDLPPALVAVIAKLLAKDRDERYHDAAELLAALEGLDSPTLAPTGSPQREASALEAADTAFAAASSPPAHRVPSVEERHAIGAAATLAAPSLASGISRDTVSPPAVAAAPTMPQAALARGRRLRWYVPVIAVAVAGAAVAAVLATRGRDDAAPASPAAAAVVASDAAPAPPDHRRLAREAERAGKLDEAIAAYLDAYTAEPDAELAFHLAELYERQQRREDAITYFQRYLHMARDAADRDAVTARIARLEQAAAPPRPGAAPRPTPPAATRKSTALVGKACHCLSRDGRPDRQSLCSRKGPSLCRCTKTTGTKLCPVAVEPCDCPDGNCPADCRNGQRCPDASYEVFRKPGMHGQPCTGHDVWSPGELVTGSWECDVCAGDPPRQFRGQHGDSCTGFYRHTGQTIAGVMDCD
jgi:eukaryotic-like serine/threonine-protein kinase